MDQALAKTEHKYQSKAFSEFIIMGFFNKKKKEKKDYLRQATVKGKAQYTSEAKHGQKVQP